VGIGLGLVWWLGTGPWFLVLFFLLGSAAAILNVYRTAVGYGLAAGYRKPDEEREEEQDKNTGDAGDGDSKGGSASTEGGKAGEVQRGKPD
jgi:ATP synthase protein I